MRFEPSIDRAGLCEAVRDAYGIPAREVRFEPVGLSSAACYVLTAVCGDRYFFKIWPYLRLGQPAANRQHATLALTRALHERRFGVCVPYAVPTRGGGLWAHLSGVPFAIFPLLPGSPPDRWTAELGERLGQTIAAIHLATPALTDFLPPREKFGIAYEPALRQDMESVARIGQDARPGLRAARKWVLEHRYDILSRLERLHELQVIVRRVRGPPVLCHTDLHGANILVDDEGQVCLLDWDDAKVAPPVHDLWAGLGSAGQDCQSSDFAASLDAYRQAGGAAPLHIEHFDFYLLRRYVEDVAVCLGELLHADADEREDAAQLHLMDACVGQWSGLDHTLATVAAALK